MSEARRVKELSEGEFDAWLSHTVTDRYEFVQRASEDWSKWLNVVLLGATSPEQVGKRISLSMSILDEVLHYDGDSTQATVPVMYFLRMLRQESWASRVDQGLLSTEEEALDNRYLAMLETGYRGEGYILWSGQILELAVLLGRNR